MKQGKKTIEDLVENLAVSTQRNFDSLGREMNGRFDEVDKKFEAVELRFDRIENLLMRAHENRLEKLEDNMRLVKTKLSIR